MSEDHALLAYGWTPAVAERFAPLEGIPGRVARVDRGRCQVVTADGPVHAVPRADPHPVTGDWVTLAGEPTEVTEVLPRTTAMLRRDPDGTGEQVLAANVDAVFVVCGLDRPLRPGRVERTVLVAWESGATPVLVLTKADLAGEADEAVRAARAAAPGVEVHLVSNVDGSGLAGLAPFLVAGSTVALLGESGAGKSSLVNALAAGAAQAVGEVRGADAKGRHTTVSRELIPVPGGGVLLDTPGLRELGVVKAGDSLAQTFPEIDELAAECRFRDCAHEREPDCGVRAALARGDLDLDRLERYRLLQRELAFEARKREARARGQVTRANRRRVRNDRDPNPHP